MLLGVVIHSARPYDAFAWIVKDSRQIPVLDGFVFALTLFRMPAFFVIAGFFAMFLIRRRTTMVFMHERMRRVLVPLLVMLFSVNLAQVWFLGLQTADRGRFIEDVLLPSFWNGSWTSHLWFLVCLAVYFTLAAAAAPWLRKLPAPEAGPGTSRTIDLMFYAVLAAAVLAPVGIAVLGSITAPALSQFLLGLVTTATLLDYLPFFAVGAMLCEYPRLLDRFARISVWVLVLAACGAVGLYVSGGRPHAAWKALHMVSTSLLTWMAIRAVFAFFREYADSPSMTFRYLSDASYSIYLFHHIVVVVVATWLLGVDLHPGVKFILVMAIASLVPLAVHHFLVRRYAVMQFLFNGVSRARNRATVSTGWSRMTPPVVEEKSP